MRIKKGFILREICGERVVSGEGLDHVNFNKMISLNPSAAYLWESVEGKDFDEETLAELLTEKYDVDKEQALSDASGLLRVWKGNGLIE